VKRRPTSPYRILVIGINYRPELTGIGPYTAGLAEYLAMRGHEVTVITGLPHYPDWRIAKGTSRTLTRTESINGVCVVRTAHYVPSRQDAVRRAVYEGSFGLTALLAGISLDRPDAILGIVPSLSGGMLARVLSARHRAPYGLLFQDLMAPAASQSGIAGGGAVANATARAEAWASAGARAVGVVTKSFEPYLRSIGVPLDRIHQVPNWTNLSKPAMPVPETRTHFGWSPGDQIVLHAGNIGLKQGLEQVVRAARLCAQRDAHVRFVFSGGGNQASAIERSARGLSNVSFLGVQPDGTHASLLAAADVLLLSEHPAQIDMSLPSKLTSYFAAGRPLVAAVADGGASASEVERSQAGLRVRPGDAEGLLAALTRLRVDPSLARKLGAAGAAYAEKHTTQSANLARGAALVDAIVGRPAVDDTARAAA
jgi:putative colanic acid biosynthesis glycosyltransferase WcaI